MLHTKSRLAAVAGCAASVLILAGCGAREPVEVPPAAPASLAPDPEASQAPESMGAPSAEAAPADGLLGGPDDDAPAAAAADPALSREDLKTWRRADGTLVTAMAPIADPEPQPESKPRSRPASEPQSAMLYAPDAVAAPAPRRSVAPTPRSNAAPSAVKAVAKPAPAPSPVARSAPPPKVIAPLPTPVKPLVAAKPDAPLARAPAPAAIAPAKAAPTPVKPLTKLQQLQAALAPEATQGAVLAAGASLGQGQEGQVTLALPATLGDRIRNEAAKLGLGKAASKTSAHADLRGDGYEITPNGRQTAEVRPGQQATFAWQVKPTPAAKGPLKTEFGVELDGIKPAQGFTLGSIARQVAPIPDAVKAKAEGVKLAMPDLGRFETIDMPGLGRMPGKSVLGGALMLLALLILVLIARNASAAGGRTERRRQRPPPMDLGRDEPNNASAVNPTATAAGGALAGAAVASAARRDDRPPAQEEYAPFDAPLADDDGPGETRDAHGRVESPELEPTR